MKVLSKAWDTYLSLVASVIAAFWLPAKIVGDIRTDLITFFAIQSAVILPAMIFTASILRPEGLTLSEAKRYGVALREQMKFWIVLLALDFVTVALLIVGEALSWEMHLPAMFKWPRRDISGVLVFFTTLLVLLAVFRMIAFVKGVLSLQALNSKMVEAALGSRSEDTTTKAPEERPAYRAPETFGRVVGHN